jgi:hypothetical protein
MPSIKQYEILGFVRSRGQAKKKEIVEEFDNYYCNGSKHIGDILTRMVNNGLLERPKKGVYQLRVKPLSTVESDPNQLSLF